MSTVESIGSEATAMCLGRFGQHVLLGTANGSVRPSCVCVGAWWWGGSLVFVVLLCSRALVSSVLLRRPYPVRTVCR